MKTTHFGYQNVPISEKKDRVSDVFHSVAKKYDLMNDLMSFGIHRLWKRFTITLANVRPGQKVLDLAGGTGDLSAQFAKRAGNNGHVILADINEGMLTEGRNKLLDQGIANVDIVQADAETLPFAENYFDCITIAFGLRNVTRQEKALQSMYRVLKPGGQCLILEFSKPILPVLDRLYDIYSFSVLPALGEIVANDADSYRYLAESIRMHPDQTTLLNMMQEAGFENCCYHNLSAGIVALHRGYKF